MIELKDIARRYRTGGQTVNALDGVDLGIARGEFVGITGPSGSGKSTLLNVLGCLVRPDAGHYLLEDAPDAVSLAVRRFLDSHPVAGRRNGGPGDTP